MDIDLRLGLTFKLILSLCILAGCDSSGQKKGASELVSATEEGGLAMNIASLHAQEQVFGAHKVGFDAAFRAVELRLQQARRGEGARRPDGDPSTVVNIVFSANIHGEVEATGSSSNRQGGLARRHSLVEVYRDRGPLAADWWGEDLSESGPTFVVDGGDLFFPSSTLDQHPPEELDVARLKARSVADLLKLQPPDVGLVGELDLVLGLSELRRLGERAGYELISANIREADGSAPFKGHRVVSRQGKRVAFIGLTRPAPQVRDYYAIRGLVIEDAFTAYEREIEAIGEVDAIVLLSNMGIDGTRALVERIREADLPLHAALVSNSNRLTSSPVWASGVPLAEPLSGGTHLGSLELFLNEGGGKSPAYANAFTDPGETIRNYRRAWASYLKAREGREVVQKELLALRQEMRGEATQSRQSRLEFLERQWQTLDAHVHTASRGYLAAVSMIDELETMLHFGEGNDWATIRIVKVAETITENPRARAIVERVQIPNP